MGAEHTKRNVKVEVIVTQAEYRKLWRESTLSPPGTVGSIIREKMGLTFEVYGKDRSVISEEQYRWEQNGKVGPMSGDDK